MTYNIQIQCCALAVLILFAIEYFLRKRDKIESNFAFRQMLIFSILLAIDDILCPIALSTPGCPHILRLITGKAYLIIMYWCGTSLVKFTIDLTVKSGESTIGKFRFYHGCTFLGAGLTLATLFLPLYYVSEQTYVYIYGPCQTLCYVFGAVVVVFLLVYMIVNRRIVPLRQRIPIYAYIVIQGLVALIEKIEPTILLTTFSWTICIGLILFTLQNPYIEELEDRNTKISTMYDKMVKALVNSVDAKDRYTRGHSQRVAIYSMEIAQRMGKSDEEQAEIYNAGLLHDIGKLRVPEMIINKRGKLTEEEYSNIKVHTVSGSRILSGVFENKIIIFAAKYHHERYDGTGYPNGLSGENIPEVARIVGVADSYDAMTSNRSYRSVLSQDIVKEEFLKNKGKQFDPVIADIMISMIDDDEDYNLREKNPPQKSILVIGTKEDAQMIKEVLHADDDYEILHANLMNEIDEIMETNYVELIITDLYTDNGMSLYKDFRKKYQTPIIVLTNERSERAINEELTLDIEDYLAKPVNPVILRECIHSIINIED